MSDGIDALEALVARLQAQAERLTAENARLRGEMEAAWRDNDVLRRDLAVVGEENARLRKAAMNAQVLADERRAEIERLNASRVALCNACKDCPDLARVTTERDGLRETLGDCICMLDILASEFGDPEGSIRGQIDESSAAVVACTPPASGEGKP